MVYSRPQEEGLALAYVGSILFSLGLGLFAAVAFARAPQSGYKQLVSKLANGFWTNYNLRRQGRPWAPYRLCAWGNRLLLPDSR